MGWTSYLLLGDLGQQLELDQLTSRLSRVARRRSDYFKNKEQDERLDELESEVMQLGAGMAALLGIVRDKKIATDAEIAAVLERAVAEVEQSAADKAKAKERAAAAAAKEAAMRKLERVRARKRD
jgi:hypothetical protein